MNRQISASVATDNYLYSDSEQEDNDGGIRMICDKGSQIQCAQVFVQGVSAKG